MDLNYIVRNVVLYLQRIGYRNEREDISGGNVFTGIFDKFFSTHKTDKPVIQNEMEQFSDRYSYIGKPVLQ